MTITIYASELQVGDVYRGQRITYVGKVGNTIGVDFADGGCNTFLADGQIEVFRKVERIEG